MTGGRLPSWSLITAITAITAPFTDKAIAIYDIIALVVLAATYTKIKWWEMEVITISLNIILHIH